MGTLVKMKFPSNWVSYIKACLHSTSFALLINEQPTDWFSPSRGVRQGDPLYPYLFILVAQNLAALLNGARHLNLIPGFSSNLRYNFNHLMYVDDLILITSASRKTARNVNLCLDIYHHLTGQKPNLNKAEIFFSIWLNKRVSDRISSILNFKQGNYPFKYLGGENLLQATSHFPF